MNLATLKTLLPAFQVRHGSLLMTEHFLKQAFLMCCSIICSVTVEFSNTLLAYSLVLFLPSGNRQQAQGRGEGVSDTANLSL
jgi:hypothetical protein